MAVLGRIWQHIKSNSGAHSLCRGKTLIFVSEWDAGRGLSSLSLYQVSRSTCMEVGLIWGAVTWASDTLHPPVEAWLLQVNWGRWWHLSAPSPPHRTGQAVTRVVFSCPCSLVWLNWILVCLPPWYDIIRQVWPQQLHLDGYRPLWGKGLNPVTLEYFICGEHMILTTMPILPFWVKPFLWPNTHCIVGRQQAWETLCYSLSFAFSVVIFRTALQ